MTQDLNQQLEYANNQLLMFLKEDYEETRNPNYSFQNYADLVKKHAQLVLSNQKYSIQLIQLESKHKSQLQNIEQTIRQHEQSRYTNLAKKFNEQKLILTTMKARIDQLEKESLTRDPQITHPSIIDVHKFNFERIKAQLVQSQNQHKLLVDTLKTQLESTQNALQKSKSALASYQAETFTFREQFKNISSAFQKKKNECDLLQQKYAENHLQIRSLTLQNTNLEARNSELETRLESASQNNQFLQNEITLIRIKAGEDNANAAELRLKTKMQELEQKLISQFSNQFSMENAHSPLLVKLKAKENQLAEKEKQYGAKLKAMKNSHIALLVDFKEKENQLAEKEKEFEAKLIVIDKLRRNLDRAKTIIRNLKKHNATLKQSIQEQNYEKQQGTKEDTPHTPAEPEDGDEQVTSTRPSMIPIQPSVQEQNDEKQLEVREDTPAETEDGDVTSPTPSGIPVQLTVPEKNDENQLETREDAPSPIIPKEHEHEHEPPTDPVSSVIPIKQDIPEQNDEKHTGTKEDAPASATLAESEDEDESVLSVESVSAVVEETPSDVTLETPPPPTKTQTARRKRSRDTSKEQPPQVKQQQPQTASTSKSHPTTEWVTLEESDSEDTPEEEEETPTQKNKTKPKPSTTKIELPDDTDDLLELLKASKKT